MKCTYKDPEIKLFSRGVNTLLPMEDMFDQALELVQQVSRTCGAWSKIKDSLGSAEMTCGRSYHSRDSEISGVHPLSKPVNFPPRVDENDCLCDGEGFIQVT